MAVQAPRHAAPIIMDKEALQKATTEIFARLGIKHDPKATRELSRRLAAESGVDPNDNAFAAEVVRMREEKLLGGGAG